MGSELRIMLLKAAIDAIELVVELPATSSE